MISMTVIVSALELGFHLRTGGAGAVSELPYLKYC